MDSMKTAEITKVIKPQYRKRIGSAVLSISLILVSLMSLFTPTAFAATPGEITLPVKQELKFSGSPANKTFKYKLTPLLAANPMPAGLASDNTFTITDSVTKNLVIKFTSGGTYYYTLSLDTSQTTGYSLAKHKYTIEVIVAGGSLNTAISVKHEQSGNKVTNITYNHAYIPPPTPSPTTRPTSPPPVTRPTSPPSVIVITRTLAPTSATEPTPSPTAELSPSPTPTPAEMTPSPEPIPESIEPEDPPTLVPQDEPAALDNGNIPGIVIGDTFVPLFGGFDGAGKVWALLNLVMGIAGIILGVITGIRAILLYKREQEEANREEIFKEEEDRRSVFYKRSFIWLIITFVMAVVGIVIFILTENMRLPIVLVDRWTIVSTVILVMEIVASVLCFRRREDTDDDYEDAIKDYDLHSGQTRFVSE